MSSETSARLSAAGFKRLYNDIRRDRSAAQLLADEIEADTRGVLIRLFKLTKKQRAAVDNTTDADLLRRAGALLAELRSEHPRPLRFRAYGEDDHPDDGVLGCTCLIIPD